VRAATSVGIGSSDVPRVDRIGMEAFAEVIRRVTPVTPSTSFVAPWLPAEDCESHPQENHPGVVLSEQVSVLSKEEGR